MAVMEIKDSKREKIKRAWRFVVSDIWDIELSSLSAIRSFGVKTLRVLHLVFKGFREDECPLHASALTFSTLMAIVPILALSLALARGFGDAETAKNKIRSMVSDWTRSFRSQESEVRGQPPEVSLSRRSNGQASLRQASAWHAGAKADGHPEDGTGKIKGEDTLPRSELAAEIDRLADDLFEKVENISFAALGGVGLLILLCMVVQVLGQVEFSFNRVWGVAVGRSIWRKFTDYLSVLLILPILIVAASSLPVVDFASRFLDESSTERIRLLLGSGTLKNLTVIVMTSLCFTFVIIFMPNTKVRIRHAIAGGIVSGLLFIGWMWLCAVIQIGAANYGKIYGSFAVVPILLAWVYVSWEIVLFGAEVAFAVQNCGTYRMEQGAHRANVQARIILALSVIVEAGRAMLGKAQNFEVGGYARDRRVSVRFLNDVVDDLSQAGFLAELSDNRGSFVLLKSPGSLRIKEVIDAVMHSGVKPGALGLVNIDPLIEQTVKRATEGIDESLKQATVQDLIA